MNERRLSRRGPVTTLRIAGGTVAVLAPFVLGVLGHSPWKALLLVPAFASSYALGRAAAWRVRLREGPATAIVSAALATVVVQLLLVAALYALGLALGALLSDVLPLDPLSSADLLFVAIVWIVTLGCAVTGLVLERRRTPSPPDR